MTTQSMVHNKQVNIIQLKNALINEFINDKIFIENSKIELNKSDDDQVKQYCSDAIDISVQEIEREAFEQVNLNYMSDDINNAIDNINELRDMQHEIIDLLYSKITKSA